MKIKRRLFCVKGDMVIVFLSKRDRHKLSVLLSSTKVSKLLWSAGWPDNCWLYGFSKDKKKNKWISDKCFKLYVDKETVMLIESLQREATVNWDEIVAKFVEDLKEDRYQIFDLYTSLN